MKKEDKEMIKNHEILMKELLKEKNKDKPDYTVVKKILSKIKSIEFMMGLLWE